MKRAWVWLVLLTIAVSCAAPIHKGPRFASINTASPSYFANERAVGRYHVQDPICAGGAVGDDTTDDTAAIASCNTQAQAVNGAVVFDAPSVAYKTTSELSIQWPGRWLGECTSIKVCAIRAHSAMRSVVELHPLTTPVGDTNLGPSVAILDGLTVDGNHLAQSGILLNGAENSRLRDMRVLNAIGACVRSGRVYFPVALSAITATVPGGSPSVGMTVTQPDPNYFFAESGGLASDTFSLKITGGGALGTATYALSINSGAYSPNQTLYGRFNLVITDGGGVEKAVGLTMTFPAGTYHVNDTYAITVTLTPGDFYNDVVDSNDFILFDKMQMGQCGEVYTTAALLGHFNPYNVSTVAGTIATTAGSNIVTGSGTSWMDVIGASGSRGVIQVGNGGTTYIYDAILDDTHISLVPTQNAIATLSGQDYAFTTYGGYYEDGGIQGMSVKWLSPVVGFTSTCFQFGNGFGGVIDHGIMNSCALGAVVVGGGNVDQALATRLESIGVGSGAHAFGAMTYMFSPYSAGSLVEPFDYPDFGGNPGAWDMIVRGTMTPLGPFTTGTWMPNSLLALNPSTQTITSNGQQLTLPDITEFVPNGGTISGQTSFLRLTSNADYTLTAFPVLAATTNPGIVLVITNVGLHVITFEDDAITSSGISLDGAHEAMQPGDTLTLVSQGAEPSHKLWRQIAFSSPYAAANGQGDTGSSGIGRGRVQTTSSAAATSIYCVPVHAATFAPPGTVLQFTVRAQSQAGVNVGTWINAYAVWDGAGNRLGFSKGTLVGTNAGGIPLGWDISTDTTGAVQCLKVAGDVSANTVTWSVTVQHRDLGQ